jgi:DNA-binding NarL/FixJ family response regulator
MEEVHELLGGLDPATEAALRESIQRFGVLVPIIRDQNGNILDGRHRSRIAGELGVDCPEVIKTVASEEEAATIARDTNLSRRHLSAEKRREIAAALRQQGHSLRAIAGALGVVKSTIATDLRVQGVRHRTPCSPVLGQDGHLYPPKQAVAERRERVAELRRLGKSRREIAEDLGVSVRVVANDVHKILRQRPEERERPHRPTRAQSLRGLQQVAAQVEALAVGLEEGLFGDWEVIHRDEEAQPYFAALDEWQPVLSARLRRAVRGWKEQR